MSTEISTEICIQRSVQEVCPTTRSEITSYYSNLAAPSNPHEILTLNVVIYSSDHEAPYTPGTTLSVRGKLAPGSKGAMVTLHVSEHLRVDRYLATIPTYARFTIVGAARKTAYGEEDCLVIQTDPEGPPLFGLMKRTVHSAAFEAIEAQDAIVLAGTFAGVLHPYEKDQVLLAILPQTLTTTGQFLYSSSASQDGRPQFGSARGDLSSPATDDARKDGQETVDANSSKGSESRQKPIWSDSRGGTVSLAGGGAVAKFSGPTAAAIAFYEESNAETHSGEDSRNVEESLFGDGLLNEADVEALGSEEVYTPAGLARRIPDVCSPWSSPVLTTKSLKRRSEIVSSDWDGRKRRKTEGR